MSDSRDDDLAMTGGSGPGVLEKDLAAAAAGVSVVLALIGGLTIADDADTDADVEHGKLV